MNYVDSSYVTFSVVVFTVSSEEPLDGTYFHYTIILLNMFVLQER